MMGNEEEMDEEDKKTKKKAYNQNLDLRKILEAITKAIEEPKVQQKAMSMLQTPKNRKWFGIRINKLMIEENWTEEEMKIFARYLKRSWN